MKFDGTVIQISVNRGNEGLLILDLGNPRARFLTIDNKMREDLRLDNIIIEKSKYSHFRSR
jgi:hypothetical protein